MNRLAQYFLICGFLFEAHAASAEDPDPISAERPGFSSSPIALGLSRFQVEGGYQFTHDGGRNDFDDHTLPFVLLRLGIASQLELQFAWAGHSWSETANLNANGFNDASIGVKWQASDSSAALPVALFASLSLPVGDDAFSSDRVDPTVGAFWSYSGDHDWFGTALVNESDGDVTFSNALGLSIPVTADIGGYIEYFGNYAGNNGPEHYLNGGLAHTPRNNLQVDINAGLGLNSRAADLFLGFGFAYRF